MSDAVTMVTCDGCAFSFSSEHANADGTFSCPVCSEYRLLQEIRELRTALRSVPICLVCAGHVSAGEALSSIFRNFGQERFAAEPEEAQAIRPCTTKGPSK